MIHSPQPLTAVPLAAALEPPLQAVEAQLQALGLALNQHDVVAVDQAASSLHLALAAAVAPFGRAARSGAVPAPLRQRLALASGQVAAQREALARATASLDRAMDVLIPRLAPGALYSADGGSERHSPAGGGLLA